MKKYINRTLENYGMIFKNEAEVLEHLFCTLGNGIRLNEEGFLDDSTFGEYDEVISLELKPLRYVYRWSDNEKYQPFRKYVGCKEVGFDKVVKYFIECIKITPNSVEGIDVWKDNIGTIENTLL